MVKHCHAYFFLGWEGLHKLWGVYRGGFVAVAVALVTCDRWHMKYDTWHVKFNIFPFFKCIYFNVATVSTHQENLCLPRNFWEIYFLFEMKCEIKVFLYQSYYQHAPRYSLSRVYGRIHPGRLMTPKNWDNFFLRWDQHFTKNKYWQ